VGHDIYQEYIWFVVSFSIFVFQAAIILYPGWREDDAAFFLIRLKKYILKKTIFMSKILDEVLPGWIPGPTIV
jgi:hypothetical protein